MPASRSELHWGRVMRCYAKRPPNVLAMLESSVTAVPDQLAVVDGDVRMDYRRIHELSLRLAGYLSVSDIGCGDRVAVMLDNCLDVVISVLALARLGAILVPIGTRLKRPEIAHMLDDAECVALVYHERFCAELPPTGPRENMRFDVAGGPWQRALGSAPLSLPAVPELADDDVFAILYTSGTTGKPKGAMLTHLNVVHSCLHWQEALGLNTQERAVLCIPWSHVAGLCGVLLPFLYLRGTLVLMAEFKRRAFFELAQRERITYALMVPAMYGLCLLESDLKHFDLAEWRIAAYGSAPMPQPTIRQFAEIFPRLKMANCYGATETTSPATIMPPDEGIARPDSIGKAVPCGDILVMTDAGVELPAGAEGELWIAGPMVVPGYWRNAEATDAAWTCGFWKSGDIGSIDDQGFVRIADRKKDMINRGGFKIYPAEVESVLAGLGGVIESAVIGVPDQMLGESVVAFLCVSEMSLTLPAVQAWCAERLADYKVPQRVEMSLASLPRNANGKIQKAELRRRASDVRH